MKRTSQASLFSDPNISDPNEATAQSITSHLPVDDQANAPRSVTAYDLIEAEYKKDIWNLSVIPGAKKSVNSTRNNLKFELVPSVFRTAVKKYIRFMMGNRSAHYAESLIRTIKNFLVFYLAKHPEAQDLTTLSRGDVEAYVTAVRIYTKKDGSSVSDFWRYTEIMIIENWIIHLQRTSDPVAPEVMSSRLFWPEDRGDVMRRQGRFTSRLKIKYIPEFVLKQVDEHMHEFMPLAYRPVVLLMRASGWRCSDIMNLRLKTCLEQTGKRWWLCGDIPKTNVENHKVPITDEIAKLIQAQIHFIEVNCRASTNPHGFLFPAVSLERQGLGLSGNALNRYLRKFAIEHNIHDEQGRPYSFSSHAFRHTKAVELINNGMPLVIVQKWMAHTTPEMTQVYAVILSTTMQDKWEEIMRNGALRIDESGIQQTFDPLSSEDKGEIEWEYIRHNLDAVRLPNGFCFKSDKFKDCPTQAIPCHTCVNFCTTSDFIPQFQAQREGILLQIDLGHSANRPQWVKRNEELLEPVEAILKTLENGRVHHPLTKAVREYSEEEWSNLSEQEKQGKKGG